MKEIQFGAVFPESGGPKFVMEVKYVMVIVTGSRNGKYREYGNIETFT